MSKKKTLFAITMVAAMPLAFAHAKPLKAEEVTTQVTTQDEATRTRAQIIEEKRAQVEVRKTELETKRIAQKDALAQKRCEAAQKRISTKAKQLENNRKMYQTVYGNMDSRLDRLVQRLDDAKLDTGELKADLATLDGMIAKLYADYDAFIASFKASETDACALTKEDFKTQFEGVRAQVELIRKDRAAIKDFFNSTIKPDLQALRSQLSDEVKAEKTEAVKTKTKGKVKQDDGSQTGTEVEAETETETTETEPVETETETTETEQD